MPGIVALKLQKSFFDVLTAASIVDLDSGAVPIYDFAPENSAYPYLTVGDDQEIPFDHFSRQGKEIQTDVHVYSQYEGFREAKHIGDQIVAALDNIRPPFPVAGFVHHFTNMVNSFAIIENELTRHQIYRFESMVSQS